jgi:glycosyltransferase involved in cell wall biosynthesis
MELKKRYNIELIMVGGAQTDPLYNEALSCGARVCGHMSNNVINLYYNAADIFISLPFTDFGVRFLGTGIAPLESLACGTPVISTGLRHFPKHDLNGVGIVPESPGMVSECISDMFQNLKRYSECREIAMKYYDWRVIVQRITNAYGELFKQYYGEER